MYASALPRARGFLALAAAVIAATALSYLAGGAPLAAVAVAAAVLGLAAVAGVLDGPSATVSDKVRAAIAAGLIFLAVVFTNAGAAILTNRLIQAGTAPKNIGWGTGTTAAAVTDTALVTEAAPTTGGGRVVGTESRVTTTVTNDTYQVVGTVTATSAISVAEAAIFDAVSAGNMFIRAVFTAIGVAIGDSIQFTFGLKAVPN